MGKKYRVTTVGSRIRFSMNIEAESKSEAKRKFDSFLGDGGMDTVGVSTLVEEIKEKEAQGENG